MDLGNHLPVQVHRFLSRLKVARLLPESPSCQLLKEKGSLLAKPGKRVLDLAGITDVLSRTKGQTRTTINYAAATFNALHNMNTTRVPDTLRERLFIHKGRVLE